jgi:hypothetical protein
MLLRPSKIRRTGGLLNTAEMLAGSKAGADTVHAAGGGL